MLLFIPWTCLTWSRELYQQTNARLWHQGQTEKVSIHHIITRCTIDESILKALRDKDFTWQRLIGAGVYASHGYERSHRSGAENTLRLLIAYALEN